LEKNGLLMVIEISTRTKESIEQSIIDNTGKQIQFDNGCYISLLELNGFYHGDTPYGLPWMCNVDSSSLDKITRWVMYWNEPRTESGSSIVL
jgi:hypothetical protein